MRKYDLFLMGVCFAAIAFAVFTPAPAVWNTVTERDEASLATPQETWAVAETCTSAGAEPNALAVTERTFITLVAANEGGDDEIEIYMIPKWVNGLRFRAIGITENGTYTVNIRAGTLGGGTDYNKAISDSLNSNTALVGTLAFVIGTQTSATTSYELADTVTITASGWPATWASKSPGGDAVAEAMIDMMGADFIAIIPTTCSADAKLLVKGY
jgi:hypothetical protein